ncbi:hypothetical protein Ddye_010025 [Dipteronia dyeriana]|uniref:MULE transposase domain-containing protein n=1 Tax=Dipteronia dyeriana TaxID=168575 RepID=A0AAD9XCS7_9ROSI|nr:hypothetical protein Ddye_010025 [Dipteronia dyeriana]
MDATKLVIHHGGSWAGNCYEGGMTKWVNVLRGVNYDALVKLVQDVAKVDDVRKQQIVCKMTNGYSRHFLTNVTYLLHNPCMTQVYVMMKPLMIKRTVSGRTLITVMIARYPTLAEIVTKMKIAFMVWVLVLVLAVLVDMDVLVHLVLLHLVVFPFDRMVWVTMLIKLLNMLPYKLGLFLDLKGILSNPLAWRKHFQMMTGYTGLYVWMKKKQFLPLAYDFGDVEDEMSWIWFLNELKNAIGSLEDCMIISDCHLGIMAAMEKVYPNIPHGYCVFHMAQNIKKDYKRKDVSFLFKQAWKACRKSEFKEAMLEIMKINRVAFEDFMNVEPERWSRAYSAVRHYRLITSSIVESINSFWYMLAKYNNND